MLVSPAPTPFLSGPYRPREGDASLDRRGDPHGDINVARLLGDPATGDGAGEEHGEAGEAAVADGVPAQGPEEQEVGVCAEVVDGGGDDDGRDLGELHVARQAHLAGRLEAEQRDGDLVDPVDVVADVFQPPFDHARLDQDRAQQDDAGLDQERVHQRRSLGRAVAPPEA